MIKIHQRQKVACLWPKKGRRTKDGNAGYQVENKQNEARPVFQLMAAELQVVLAVVLAGKFVPHGKMPALNLQPWQYTPVELSGTASLKGYQISRAHCCLNDLQMFIYKGDSLIDETRHYNYKAAAALVSENCNFLMRIGKKASKCNIRKQAHLKGATR